MSPSRSNDWEPLNWTRAMVAHRGGDTTWDTSVLATATAALRYLNTTLRGPLLITPPSLSSSSTVYTNSHRSVTLEIVTVSVLPVPSDDTVTRSKMSLGRTAASVHVRRTTVPSKSSEPAMDSVTLVPPGRNTTSGAVTCSRGSAFTITSMTAEPLAPLSSSVVTSSATRCRVPARRPVTTPVRWFEAGAAIAGAKVTVDAP
mmetsp:Transcript_61523/g.124887  ORF Transcript_61523/g.124887 Transcript_61523/m.124887 type:complete len:202 (+) Transcript_61523:779-1384(+)